MKDYPGLTWLAHYRDRVNADPELKVIGDWFTTTFALQSGFKCSSIEQPNSSTPKERKRSPNFASAEASGSQVIPIFLLMLPMAPLSSTRLSQHARDTHTTEKKTKRGRLFTTRL